MSLRVWLPLNGNLNNQGLSDVTVTNNSATIDNNGKIGKCYKFEAGGAKITNTLSSPIESSIGTMSCWIKFNSFPANNAWYCLMHLGAIGGFAQCRLGLYMEYQNYIVICINGSSNYNRYLHSLTINRWYHLCATFDGTTIRLYIDGAEVWNKIAVVGSYTTDTSTLFIGSTNNYYFKGYMNDVRYYDHALSAKEVKLLSKGLVCHYPLNGINNSILPLGYQQLEYIESSGKSYFNTEYYFNPEIDSYKIEFKGNDITNNGMILANVNNNTGYIWVYYYGNGNRISMWLHDGTSGAGGGAFTQDLNKHIMEYDNKRNYIDGNLINNFSAKTYVQCGEPLYMFSYNNSYSYPFKGRIYYVNIKREGKPQRIYIPAKRLSDNAIGMYELINDKFCTSITSTPFDAGPVIDTPTTIYDCSGYKNDMTPVGTISSINDSAKYSKSIHSINGSYIIADKNCPEYLPKDAITVNIWIKPTIWGNPISCTEGGGWNFEAANNIIRFSVYIQNTGYKLAESSIKYSDLQDGNWHMLTGTFSNIAQEVKIYIDGVLQATTIANSNLIGYVSNKLIIAGEASGQTPASSTYVGDISDVRIYATALSPNDILELYKTFVSIDNKNKLYTYEFSETLQDLGVKFTKQGVINTSGEEMKVEEEDMINGFVETDEVAPTKVYKNYVSANEFIEI